MSKWTLENEKHASKMQLLFIICTLANSWLQDFVSFNVIVYAQDKLVSSLFALSASNLRKRGTAVFGNLLICAVYIWLLVYVSSKNHRVFCRSLQQVRTYEKSTSGPLEKNSLYPQCSRQDCSNYHLLIHYYFPWSWEISILLCFSCGSPGPC